MNILEVTYRLMELPYYNGVCASVLDPTIGQDNDDELGDDIGCLKIVKKMKDDGFMFVDDEEVCDDGELMKIDDYISYLDDHIRDTAAAIGQGHRYP